jgi:hypothetical protein
MPKVDWEALSKDIGAQGLDVLKGLLVGAEEDLKQFGVDIASDLARAMIEGRPEITAEIQEQVKVLAEIHRIKANGATWEFVGSVFATLAKVARMALVAGGIAL